MTRSPLTIMVILYFRFIQLTKSVKSALCSYGNLIKSNKHLLSTNVNEEGRSQESEWS